MRARSFAFSGGTRRTAGKPTISNARTSERAGRSQGEHSHVKRIVLVPLAALAIASSTISAQAAPTPKPSASPTPSKDADPCGSTKSKWQHLQCQEFNGSAPGDEYFGRMKISYLGIDNTFRDGAISAGAYTTDSRIITKLQFADDALTRWAAKYPSDPQLARAYFLGMLVFRKVYTQPAQQTAWRYVQLLAKTYPTTYFGKTAKTAMATGFVEHWFALPQLCPTPLPKGVMPEKTPNATASPSPAPGQPVVDIITPPCVKPSPTPEPSETPTPEPRGRHSAPMPAPTATTSPIPQSPAPRPAASPA
jgi:hypothetical protein